MAGVREYTTKAPLEAYPSKSPISPGGRAHIAKPEKSRREPILYASNINERGIDERIERAEKIRVRANLLATPRSLERPPEQFLSPFDPEFIAQFQQKLYDYIEERYGIPGGNPHKMDIMGMVEEISAKRLPELWNNFTGGRVLWEDRERVRENNSKAWNAWIQAINQYRSKIGSALKTRRADAIKDYEYEMGKLDTRIKMAKANLEEQRKLRQPPESRTAYNPDKRQLEYQKWVPELQGWEFTGVAVKPPEKPKEEKPEYEAGQALKQINNILKAKAMVDKGNIVTDALFAMIAKEDPDAAKEILPFLNRKLSGDERADLKEVWRKRIEYLMPFIPEGSKPKISWLTKTSKVKEIKARIIVERRTYKGRNIVKYTDGTIKYE